MKDLKPILLYLISCPMGCTNIDFNDSSPVAKTEVKIAAIKIIYHLFNS